MSYDDCGHSEGWIWESSDCILDKNTRTEISKTLALGQKRDHLSCMFDSTTTPLKSCGDLPYHLSSNEIRGKELDYCGESYSQAKRRRVLHFDSDFLDSTLCNDDVFLRSKETPDSFEDDISEISHWVAGFTENTIACSDELLDASCEGWITDCLNDNELQCSTEDMIAGVSDVQIDITDICTSPVEYETNVVEKLPIHTPRSVILKGKNSSISMRTPPKLASSIVYPFTFIKPCGVHGDLTLNDINQRLHTPKSKKIPEQDDTLLYYPTSAFSGKPVVGKTKIRTEGGGGSITIVRTKG